MPTSEFTLASSDHSLFSDPMDIGNLSQALSTSLAIDRAPSLLIYQSVFVLVHASYAAKSQTDNLNALDVHRVTMSGDDSISAIIKSLNSRKVLLQFAAAIGIHGDAGLREALRQDEERLAEHIVRILNSDSDGAAVQNLEGDSAQIFLDVLQNTLDRGLLLGKEHNSKARRMILKLSEACDRLPSALFITGVTGRDEFALFGGGFGDIYQASYAGQTVALKLLRHFPRDAEQRRIRLQFCREALVWQRLRHPHILPLLGIDRDTFPSSLCMVSPWMQNGTVLKYLNDHGRANVDKLLWEVAQGLHYLHSQNLVHGDLRGSNILITPEWRACLTDFGLASISDATTKGTTKQSGSIRWMAPELIDPSQFGGRFLRTFASDVYAFGCVCIELYTGQPPFTDLIDTAAMFKVIKGERPERPRTAETAMSDALWRRVTEYWAHDPAARTPTVFVMRQMKLNYTGTDSSSLQPAPFPQGELEWPLLHQSAEEEAGDFDPLAWTDTGIMDRMRSLVCPDNPKSIYVMISKLGEGWFGPVYQARETATRRRVAIARNDMTNQQKHFFLDHLLLLKEMKHPNIVLFLESYLVGPEELWIVSEFIEGLDLSEIVGNHQLAEEQMSNICLQTCQGLEHLHSRNIIHRDIRPDNIFIDPQGCVKIKGFGFCVKLTSQRPRRTSMAGKPHWMAPEVAKQTESDGKKVEYDGKVDVWSLGITTLELSGAGNGPGPYMNDEPLTALYFVGPAGTPTLTDADALSPELRNFLESCLSVDVQRRATVAELLNHPFLQMPCNSAGLMSLLKPTWVKLRRHVPQHEKQAFADAWQFGEGKVVNHM